MAMCVRNAGERSVRLVDARHIDVAVDFVVPVGRAVAVVVAVDLRGAARRGVDALRLVRGDAGRRFEALHVASG